MEKIANTINYKLPCGDLASRRLAIAERHKLELFLTEGKTVKLDLEDVLSLSESYSDEIFGVLVVKLGANTVLKNIRIENASPSILKSIAKVIQRRHHEVLTRQATIQTRGKGFDAVWVTA
ncbi:STAS-like domain-containing protein [Pectobacterium versatile]|uniref:STAS-like domain-containing protein n=1 Tax=Pectobacterium versatile TaxID=2488639 RepID=UPI00381A21B6